MFDKEDEYEEVIEESESVNKIKEQKGFCVVLSKRGYQMSYDVVERIVRNVFYNLEGDAEEKKEKFDLLVFDDEHKEGGDLIEFGNGSNNNIH